MAATQVQGKGVVKAVLGDQNQTISFASALGEGNLLICVANVDDGFEAVMVSPGWTKIVQEGSGLAGHGAYAAFWKLAGSAESQAVEMDYGEVNRRGGMIIYEYSHPDGLQLDQFVATHDGVSNNAKSSGTTPALSSDAILGVACLCLPDDNATGAGTSWDNGFVLDLAAQGLLVDTFSAVKDLDGTDETIETTCTFNGTAEIGTHGLLIFRTAASGGLASFRDAVATDAAASDASAVDAVARDVGA